jgi:F0F1-type ATP synthase assembly protein I
MKFLIVKYLVTAAVVVLVSEFAKANDRLGAFIAALPIVTLLTIIWMRYEHQPLYKITNHAFYTFWYVLPTLPIFLILPYLLNKWSFWPSVLMSVSISLIIFYFYAQLLKVFGIDLL